MTSRGAQRAVGAAVALAVGVGLWWASGVRPAPRRDPAPADASTPSAAPSERPPAAPVEAPPRAPADAGAPPDRTVVDRALRDQIRRQIYAAWAGAAPAVPAEAPAPDALHAPMPELDGGSVDPEYLRARIREDFLPMAQVCYEHYLARAPGAAGRVVADFVVVGDERVGGVVDEVTLEAGDGGLGDGGLGDREFETCVRESMTAMAFRPPPRRGRLRVRYPFRFEPGDGGAAATR